MSKLTNIPAGLPAGTVVAIDSITGEVITTTKQPTS